VKSLSDKTNIESSVPTNAASDEVRESGDKETTQAEKLFRAGEIIMRQGDAGDCAYFIKSGRVGITLRRDDGVELEMGQRGAGSVIGEMAIVDDGPRSATVRAIEDCQLLEISKADFSRAGRNTNPIVGLVTKLILMRYRDVLHRSEALREFADVRTVLEQQERFYAEESHVLEVVLLANEFKVAVAREELFLDYQPFMDVNSGDILGFEALMRWHHPEKGPMAPDLFIPMAEETGLIVDATRWALREACNALRRFIDLSGNESLFVSVNFSAQDFDDPGFLGGILSIVRETGLRPEQLHLEITERLLLHRSESVRQMLIECREKGMEIAIDDFGTGYSSLSYLHQYPVTTLKIDQSFISNMTTDKGALGLVKTILSLNENMGLSIIAEGVETQEQVDLLKSMKCQVAQGFYFSKPLSEEAAALMLRQKHE
jgi:diguanylate cyclase